MKRILAGVLIALSSPAIAAEPAKTPGALLQQHRHSVAVVQGVEGGGSAFIAKIGKGKYLITNQHVVAGLTNPTFTTPDRALLKVGTAAAAVGHDIISFGVTDDVTAIEAMQGVDQNVMVGDAIVVLGNPDAAGVIRPITGKIDGIGPKLVEISAPIVAGNSGSPIIHQKTGKVIGVATYLQRAEANIAEGRLTPTIRRFGYRIDSIKQWEPVRWWQYHDDYETVEKVRQRSKELISVLLAGPRGTADMVTDRMVQAPLEKFHLSMKSARNSQEGVAAAQTFMRDLQRAASEDIDHARRRVGYDFFKETLAEEERFREPIAGMLDLVVKRISGR